MTILKHLMINHIEYWDKVSVCLEEYKQHKNVNDIYLAYKESKIGNSHMHILIEYNAYTNTVNDAIKRIMKPTGFKSYKHVAIQEYHQIYYIIHEKNDEPKECIINTLTDEDIEFYKNTYPNKDKKKVSEYETYLKELKHKHIGDDDFASLANFTLNYLLEQQLQEDKQTPLSVIKNKSTLWCRKANPLFNENYKTLQATRYILEVCGSV